MKWRLSENEKVIQAQMESMLGCPVAVAMSGDVLAFKAKQIECDVRVEDHTALTDTMDDLRSRYLVPVADYIRERMR